MPLFLLFAQSTGCAATDLQEKCNGEVPGDDFSTCPPCPPSHAGLPMVVETAWIAKGRLEAFESRQLETSNAGHIYFLGGFLHRIACSASWNLRDLVGYRRLEEIHVRCV